MPDGSPLYGRILAALQSGPMVGNPEWRARQICELVEAETAPLTLRLEAIQDVLGPLALPNESEAGVATRIAADAALWREVRPLMLAWRLGRMKNERALMQWVMDHMAELEAL